MTGRNGQTEQLLEAYLDGDLSGEELARFEQRLEEDAELRRQVEIQRRVDAALRRRFAPADSPPGRVLMGEPQRGAGHRRWPSAARWPVLAAAAAVLLVVGGWAVWARLAPNRLALDRLYARHVEDGLVPQWICRDNDDYEQFLSRRFGRGLHVMDVVPRELELIGWRFDPALSPDPPYAATLLARFDGEPVLVFVDDTQRDRRVGVRVFSGLNVHRRVVNDLVLYEVSPFGQPRASTVFIAPP